MEDFPKRPPTSGLVGIKILNIWWKFLSYLLDKSTMSDDIKNTMLKLYLLPNLRTKE